MPSKATTARVLFACAALTAAALLWRVYSLEARVNALESRQTAQAGR